MMNDINKTYTLKSMLRGEMLAPLAPSATQSRQAACMEITNASPSGLSWP